MRTLTESTIAPVTLAELQSRVPPGSASRPIAKLTFRLCAPLRWWLGSRLRIVVVEICSLPLRIASILDRPSLRWGIPIPVDPQDHDPGNPEIMCSYLRACTKGIRDLRNERRIVSALDVEIYVRAFQQGAAWRLGSVCNRSDKEAALDHPSVPSAFTEQ